MFQETVLRNIPFCDEYVFIANRKYENIIRGQLKAFQRIRYSFLFEEESAHTALPVTMALLRCREKEEVLIVSTDAVLNGDYNSTVLALKNLVYRNQVGIVGASVINDWEGYNYIAYEGTRVLDLTKKKPQGDCLWDCGIIAGRAGTLLAAMDPQWVAHCRLRLGSFSGVITREVIFGIYPVSLGNALRKECLTLVPASFYFYRIVDLKTYNDYKGKVLRENFSIKTLCKDVDVINTDESKAVVLNNVEDLLVVNTADALYISHKEDVADIKDIVRKHHAQNPVIFDEGLIQYYPWGMRRTLYKSTDYRITKVSVYVGSEVSTHTHKEFSETYTLLQGYARVRIGSIIEEYARNNTVYCPAGRAHRIENIGTSELVFLETRIGSGLLDEAPPSGDEALVRLEPYIRRCIWGGTKLGRVLGKRLDGVTDAGESWELSTHPDGESTIAEGKYAGKTLSQFIDIIGREKLGWKCQAFARFPILIKFIDARESLSIQVHPDDEYAFPNENEYGKNEMWYIVSASRDAYIYAGFNRDVTREEVERRVADKTLEEILRKIPVQAGQTYFLRAGTVHAIGKGCLICEIQQSSNVTYRLYDYDKVDKNGNKRELHVQKALDVLNFKSSVDDLVRRERRFFPYKNGLKEILAECKYFSATRYEARGVLSLSVDYSSFLAMVVLEGRGTVTVGNREEGLRFKKGDTFFGVAKEYTFRAIGKISVIAVTL